MPRAPEPYDTPAGPVLALEDLPRFRRRAARAQRVAAWLPPAPGIALLDLVMLSFFPYAASLLAWAAFGLAVVWLVGASLYAVCSWSLFRCPSCRRLFGMAGACGWCGLPRGRTSYSAAEGGVPAEGNLA
jgi:hypothetical protein